MVLKHGTPVLWIGILAWAIGWGNRELGWDSLELILARGLELVEPWRRGGVDGRYDEYETDEFVSD